MRLWFLDASHDLTSALPHTYNPPLVVASVVIACLAGYAALSAAGRIAKTEKTTAKLWWLLTGAFTMGVGVWTMHFIAMLAFKLPVPVDYDLSMTLLSTVPAIFASGLMLWLISQARIQKSRLVVGGTLMGAGIGMMHYIGMAAMRMDALMLFDPLLVALSVVVAVVLAIAALYTGLLVRIKGGNNQFNWAKLEGALFMGCAVSAMHYTGMAAAYFFPGDAAEVIHTGLNPQFLGGWAAMASLFITGLTVFMTLVDSRLEGASRVVQLLQNVAVAANQAVTRDDALQTALNQVCAYTGWPLGHAYVLDDDYANGLAPTKLWYTADNEHYVAFREVTETLRMMPGVGLPGRVLVTGKPVLITDVVQAPNFPRAKLAQQAGLKSCFAFPVLIGKEVVAVLEFFSSAKEEPDPALMEVMAHVGAQIGRVFERQRAAETIDWNNRELLRLSEKLKEENLRLSAEVEIARQLQLMLLPTVHELDHIQHLDIACFMEPATEVGGDYYDILHYGGRTLIAIGDVTGHGLHSGVVMLMVQVGVRALAVSNETDPVRFFDVLNRTIYDNVVRIGGDKTLSLAVLDFRNGGEVGEVRVSGQHEQMIVVRHGGAVELVDTLNLGFPVGLENKIAGFIGEKNIELRPGDGIVLYTDGFTEAENPSRQQYGLERLCAVISRHWAKSAQAIKDAVVADVHHFIDVQTLFDDLTLVVVKQKSIP